MSFLFFVVAAASATNGPAAVGALEGCWRAAGEVRGKDATSVARGEWHLGKRYFILHLRSVSPAQPYEAAITYGAGAKSGQLGSFWMDTFGGLYEPSLGLGAVTDSGFSLDYRFPDAVYRNRFERTGNAWHWTILERAPGKPDKLFAEYKLSRATCRGIRFQF